MGSQLRLQQRLDQMGSQLRLLVREVLEFYLKRRVCLVDLLVLVCELRQREGVRGRAGE
jgi:hypothetical protein